MSAGDDVQLCRREAGKPTWCAEHNRAIFNCSISFANEVIALRDDGRRTAVEIEEVARARVEEVERQLAEGARCVRDLLANRKATRDWLLKLGDDGADYATPTQASIRRRLTLRVRSLEIALKRIVVDVAVNNVAPEIISIASEALAGVIVPVCRCATPDACSWEANHQRMALERLGLANEFADWGCDAIDNVAEALVASRAQVATLKKSIGESIVETDQPALSGGETARSGSHEDGHATTAPIFSAYAVAQLLVQMMYLYPNYRVDARGPRGCIWDALRLIAPEIADEIALSSWDKVYKLRWGDR